MASIPLPLATRKKLSRRILARFLMFSAFSACTYPARDAIVAGCHAMSPRVSPPVWRLLWERMPSSNPLASQASCVELDCLDALEAASWRPAGIPLSSRRRVPILDAHPGRLEGKAFSISLCCFAVLCPQSLCTFTHRDVPLLCVFSSRPLP